jgi:ADP-ribose pyrophosphatase YjhB (NUDIX family)
MFINMDYDKAGVILFSPNKKYVLMVKAKSNYKKYSKWGFPKGRLEPYENMNECAMRELREETGLDINISKEIMENTIRKELINRSYYYCYILNNNMMKDIMNKIKTYKDDSGEIETIAFVPLDRCFELILNSHSSELLQNYEYCLKIAVKL